MGDATHDGLAVPGRVVLAHEPPFHLGMLEVEPATRQVKAGERRETLEPRVMQVLVALHQAKRIVTRDKLIERCWDGRIVGEDAINRVISRLRQIAVGIGGGSFAVETITKVGYRLQEQPVGARPGTEPVGSGKGRAHSRRDIVAGLALAGGAAGVGFPLIWSLTTDSQIPPKARDLYQRALALQSAAGPYHNRQEIAFLREAVRIAPDYGEAWGRLAYEYRMALLSGPAEDVAGYSERLGEALRQADRHDPGNADADFARRVYRLHHGRWVEAEAEYRHLAKQYARHPTGPALLGRLFMDVGRWHEAVEQLRRSTALSALAPVSRYLLVTSLWSAGLISEAEREIDEALRWSAHTAIWQTKIKLMALTGRPATALAILNDSSTRPDDISEDFVSRRRLFLQAMITGQQADVERALASEIADARNFSGSVPHAFNCALLGDLETALDMLEGAYLGTGGWMPKRPISPGNMVTHPLFQPQARTLWGHPRFDRILERIGLEYYWRATRTLPDYRHA